MVLINYSSYFTKVEKFQGGGDNLDLPEIAIDQVSDKMEETIDTNEGYWQHGREVTDTDPNSPITSQKSTPSKKNNKTDGMEMGKTSTGGSDDGGDKYPPRKNLEKSHIAYTSVRRKRNTSTTGMSILEIRESPWATNIDELIKEFSWFA